MLKKKDSFKMMMSAARIENSLPSSKPVEDVAHRNLGPRKVFNALVDYLCAEKLGFSSSAVGRGSDVEKVISDIATAFFNLSEDYHVLIASTHALKIPKEFKLSFLLLKLLEKRYLQLKWTLLQLIIPDTRKNLIR